MMGATWPAILQRQYFLDPLAGSFDYKTLNTTATDILVDQVQTTKGLQYLIGLVVNFDNPILASTDEFKMTLGCSVYYKGSRLITASTIPQNTIGLKVGRNSRSIRIVSDPSNTDLLMEMVGRVAEGEDVNVSIRDLKVGGLQVVQDIVDGLEFNVTVPGAVEDLANEIRYIL